MKTTGQVLYEQDVARHPNLREWCRLSDEARSIWEANAAAVLAHDRANQPAASGVWIPVSERLPTPYEPVLGFAGSTVTVVRTAKPAHQDGALGWRIWPTDAGNSPWMDVSHWQPLPAAPEAPKP